MNKVMSYPQHERRAQGQLRKFISISDMIVAMALTVFIAFVMVMLTMIFRSMGLVGPALMFTALVIMTMGIYLCLRAADLPE